MKARSKYPPRQRFHSVVQHTQQLKRARCTRMVADFDLFHSDPFTFGIGWCVADVFASTGSRRSKWTSSVYSLCTLSCWSERATERMSGVVPSSEPVGSSIADEGEVGSHSSLRATPYKSAVCA